MADPNTINIQGLDKVVLLKKMWTNMKPAAFFSMSGMSPPPFDNVLAAQAVGAYIDYFQGRCIKTDLSGNNVNPRLYDRDAGDGTLQRIVDSMRQ